MIMIKGTHAESLNIIHKTTGGSKIQHTGTRLNQCIRQRKRKKDREKDHEDACAVTRPLLPFPHMPPPAPRPQKSVSNAHGLGADKTSWLCLFGNRSILASLTTS